MTERANGPDPSEPAPRILDGAALEHPHPAPPAAGEVLEVAPGVLWARLGLPYRLDHINIFLIADRCGWAILDAGLGDAPSIAAWEALLAGPLKGERLSRLIVTHMHPDHIGLAGWLCERFGLPLLTSQTTWLQCLNVSLGPGALDAPHFRDFYQRHGLGAATTEMVVTQGHRYLKIVTPLPGTFRRLVDGDRLTIGEREFEVLTGDGHAPEQVMLHCREAGLFFGADQVLAKITPNVSVWAVEPEGNPLGLYLRSLRRLRERVADDALVLPGHQLPFYGLHERARQLAAHHASRCALIVDAAAQAPHSVAELVPVIFPRALDPHQLGFAFSEVHAHVNLMVEEDRLAWTRSDAGVMRVAAP
ncbi:MAG TPA: MBL fold metallo-hydrolase [Paracoccaceae bacterium]|nr:MBL fold metallo-hydrolase [Paracoccaceae bacterium]